MKGSPVVLVNKESATHSRPSETAARFILPINRAHSEIVKFERFSDDYECVLACIRELLENRSSHPPTT